MEVPFSHFASLNVCKLIGKYLNTRKEANGPGPLQRSGPAWTCPAHLASFSPLHARLARQRDARTVSTPTQRALEQVGSA
jgi:hypothetical protein